MGNKKRTALMYGAGNIGRGFIGQIFSDSGFEVVFIDVNRDVVCALNAHKQYTQLIIDGDETIRREISGVCAVDGNDKDAVARAIAECEIMAVSVGAAVLPFIAPLIAGGLSIRERPLNILVCENLAHAPDVLRDYICEHLQDSSVLNNVGFVGATIGRMVPVMPAELRKEDPTLIAVEKFCFLPIDADAVVSPMPELVHTAQLRPFALEEGKKLYIHNMGHSLAAYFGAVKGYEYIWQSISDETVARLVSDAMNASAEALARKYDADRASLREYVNDLLSRFTNKGLGDTVARVGGDPLRKLAPRDRFMGAIDLSREQGIDYSPVLLGIAAALKFDIPNDPSAGKMQDMLKETGVFVFLKNYCGLCDKDAQMCIDNSALV